MLNKLFAVYDAKAQSYGQITTMKRREEAVRSFTIACNSVESDFHKYAEDYSLFELAELDLDSGIVKPYQQPLMVITAIQASTQHKDYYAKVAIDKLQAVS